MALTASIKDKQLIIRIDLNDPPRPSATGKSTVIASTNGNLVSSLLWEGKPVTIGLNAYVK